MKKNVSSQMIGAQMTYAASGTPITASGAVLTYLTMDGGAIALGSVNSGICIPRSYGWHYYIAAASETNFDHIAFTFVASGGINITNQLYTSFPQTGDSFPGVGSLSTQLSSVDARVTSASTLTTSDVGVVDSGTAQSATGTTLVLRAAAGFADGELVGATVVIVSATTGAGQSRIITGYAGATDTATVDAWTTTPTGTIVYRVFASAPASTTALPSVDVVKWKGATAPAMTGDAFAAVGSLDTRVSSVGVQVGSNAVTLSSLHTRVSSVQTGVDNIYARIGTPVGASLAIDVKSIQTQVDSIYGRIGENGINITSASVSVGGATVTDIASSALVRLFNRASGLFYTDAVSGSVVREIAHTAVNSSVQANSIQIGVNSLYARIGAPVGASIAVDIKSIQTQVDSIYGRIGENGINLTSISVVGGSNVTVADITSAALTRFFNRDSGLYYSSAVSGSVVLEITKNAGGASLTVTDIASAVWGASSAAALRSQISSVDTRVTSAAVEVSAITVSVASLQTRVSSVQTGVDNIYTRIGAPAGASVSVDVSSVQAGVNALTTNVGSIQVGVNSLSTTTGSLHTRVSSVQATGDAIKAKTDNLPTDPADESLIIAATDNILANVSSVAVNVASTTTALASLHTRVSSVQTGADNIFSRIGAPVGASIAVDVGSVQAGVTAITTNVGSIQTGVNSLATNTSSIFTAIASLQTRVNSVQTGADAITTNLSSVQVGVNSIYIQANKLQFGGANRVLSDLTAVNSDATAAANLAKTTRAIGRGVADAGGTPGNIPTITFTPAGVGADQFLGRIITFDADTLTTGLRGQATDILSNSGIAAPLFGVTSLTTAPVSGDTFSVT